MSALVNYCKYVGIRGIYGLFAVAFLVGLAIWIYHKKGRNGKLRRREAYVELGFAVSIIISSSFDTPLAMLISTVLILLMVGCIFLNLRLNDKLINKKIYYHKLMWKLYKTNPFVNAELKVILYHWPKGKSFRYLDSEKVVKKGLQAERDYKRSKSIPKE